MTITVSILHGDDTLGVEEAAARKRADMGDGTEAEMNITEFEGSTVSVPEVLSAVSSYPFLSDRRMVIVKGLLSWLTRSGAGQAGKDGIKRLEADLPDLPPHARLIFVERETLKPSHPIIKAVRGLPNGEIKLYEGPKDATDWIVKRAESHYGVQIDRRAAQALATVIVSQKIADLRLADNELVKLADFVEPGEPITEADVAALTPYVPEANIFDMAEAISRGNGQQALALMHRLMRDKKQDAFSLFGMILRQFRLLLLTKELVITGTAKSEYAGALGLSAKQAFLVDKLTQQARRFEIEDLERIYQVLYETDYAMKRGQMQPELALDLFVATVAG